MQLTATSVIPVEEGESIFDNFRYRRPKGRRGGRSKVQADPLHCLPWKPVYTTARRHRLSVGDAVWLIDLAGPELLTPELLTPELLMPELLGLDGAALKLPVSGPDVAVEGLRLLALWLLLLGPVYDTSWHSLLLEFNSFLQP